jgi:chromosome segregation ATPase
MTQPALSAAMNGKEAYLTQNLFQKICAAFPGIFNLDYLLTGQGELLLESNVQSEPSTTKKPASADADFYHDALNLNAKVIEDMRKDLEYFKSSLLDKDSTIQENNEQVITMRTQLVKLQTELDHIKNTLAAVRKNYDRQVDDLAQRDATIKLLQAQLARYSTGTTFPQGVADERSLITPDK